MKFLLYTFLSNNNTIITHIFPYCFLIFISQNRRNDSILSQISHSSQILRSSSHNSSRFVPKERFFPSVPKIYECLKLTSEKRTLFGERVATLSLLQQCFNLAPVKRVSGAFIAKVLRGQIENKTRKRTGSGQTKRG